MKKNNLSNSIILFLKDNKLLLIILIVFFLIKVFFITTRYHLPIWDEAVYLGMGKYIYSAGNAGLWEMIRPFGLPLFTGAIWISGLDQIYTTQFLAILFSCATIFMTYMIAKELFDKKIALLSVLMLVITPLFFLYSIYVMTEIPSTFFVLLSIYFYLKKKYFLSGLFAGVALLFRFPQGLIIVPIGLAIITDWFLEKKKKKIDGNKQKKTDKTEYSVLFKRILFYGIGLAIIIIPFISLNYIMYNAYTSKATDALFRPLILASPHQGNLFESIRGTSLSSQLYNIFYYIIMMLKNNVLFILSLAGAIMLLVKFKEHAKILSFTIIIYLAYYSYIINKQERFMITFLPIICILTAYFIYYIIRKIIPKDFKQIKDYNNLSDVMRRSALVSIIIIAILLTSGYAIIVDTEYYYWLHSRDNKPEIVNDYYHIIEDMKIRGSILISEPVLTAFTDNKLIEYTYENGAVLISNEWEANDDITAVAYSYDTIPCLEEDERCKNMRESLFNYFDSNYEMYYEKEFYGQKRYIFLKR